MIFGYFILNCLKPIKKKKKKSDVETKEPELFSEFWNSPLQHSIAAILFNMLYS